MIRYGGSAADLVALKSDRARGRRQRARTAY